MRSGEWGREAGGRDGRSGFGCDVCVSGFLGFWVLVFLGFLGLGLLRDGMGWHCSYSTFFSFFLLSLCLCLCFFWVAVGGGADGLGVQR